MPEQLYITLPNGVRIPQVGIGMWEAKDGAETVQNVKWAVKAGYRHIDTAFFYKNEVSVGQGIRECGVPREELFVTTKLWNTSHGYDKALAAFEVSRANLGVEYIDLYLIHWPGSTESFVDTWRALEKLYEEKKVRAIGVSNFLPHQLDALLAKCKIAPMMNQIELHPLMQQKETLAYCRAKNIPVTAYRPLGKGAILSNPRIVEIAAQKKRSVAQVIIRFIVQLGVVVIPKSSNEDRIKENFDVFDFELTEEEMRAMEALNEDKRLCGHPDSFFPLN